MRQLRIEATVTDETARKVQQLIDDDGLFKGGQLWKKDGEARIVLSDGQGAGLAIATTRGRRVQRLVDLGERMLAKTAYEFVGTYTNARHLADLIERHGLKE